MKIETPYLLFLGNATEEFSVKIANSIVDWRPELCIGEAALPDCTITKGLPRLWPAEARERGARTLVVCANNAGGYLEPAWIPIILEALEAGLDVASGMHERLGSIAEVDALARAKGRQLLDVRHTTEKLRTGTGKKRSGKRLLTVGTDCSVGKMYTALAMDAEMRERGMKSTFRATGQTGILITGDGVPLDAVIADFMAGSIEYLTPDNDPDHWDLIEGQGSLFHVSYSGVTMALIHGGQPDALVLAHEPTRAHMRGLPGYDLPTLEALRDMALPLARIANPACEVVAVSVNTQHMSEDEATAYLADIEARMGLPATDPYRFGAGKLVDALEALG